MALSEAFAAHLASGQTTIARAWIITRKDGVTLGFTDHDGDLLIDGVLCKADSGLTALALQQSTGLSVDNTEALGALSDSAITDADIDAGRYDGAEVVAWLVNWADTTQRHVQFRGTIGEIRRGRTAFEAELRGLTDQLNRPLGRVYQKPCTAVLGDARCRFDLTTPGYAYDGPVVSVEEARVFVFPAQPGFDEGWFQRGRLLVNSGPAEGLSGLIKTDVTEGDTRRIELWEPIRASVDAGEWVRLEAGCDKRFETCRQKFANLMNFQGFPDIPEDDWMTAFPARQAALGGGSRR